MKKHAPSRTELTWKNAKIALSVLSGLLLIAALTSVSLRFILPDSNTSTKSSATVVSSITTTTAASLTVSSTSAPAATDTLPTVTPSPTVAATATPTPTPTVTPTSKPTTGGTKDLSGYVVVLDPGHQTHANNDQEPLSPGSTATKAKCSSGTSGVATGRQEYVVNLEIALKVRDYLESLGCTVYMTRTENDVDISNIERAQFALSYMPDAYIRIHCNGADDPSVHGVSVFVADSGKYEDQLVGWGKSLGKCITAATGAKYLYCNATDTYSGLNWATDIPSFLLELGFMTNADEDQLLSDPDYQQKIAIGVADFVAKMPINPDR